MGLDMFLSLPYDPDLQQQHQQLQQELHRLQHRTQRERLQELPWTDLDLLSDCELILNDTILKYSNFCSFVIDFFTDVNNVKKIKKD